MPQLFVVMDHVNEVNTQAVLVRIAQRLPQYLKTRWIRDVQSIRNKDRSLNIEDLIAFIESAAEEANDPVFGSIPSYNFSKMKGKYGNRVRERHTTAGSSSTFLSTSAGEKSDMKSDGNAGHNLTSIASQFAMHLGFTCDVISITHRSD